MKVPPIYAIEALRLGPDVRGRTELLAYFDGVFDTIVRKLPCGGSCRCSPRGLGVCAWCVLRTAAGSSCIDPGNKRPALGLCWYCREPHTQDVCCSCDGDQSLCWGLV